MSIRSFSLNSPELYEAVSEPRERPWIPNGALPREPRRPKADDGVWVGSAQSVQGLKRAAMPGCMASTANEHCQAETHDAALDGSASGGGMWRRGGLGEMGCEQRAFAH